jgi:hypothetical protein
MVAGRLGDRLSLYVRRPYPADLARGDDLTPASAPARCPGIGPAGWPAWGPGGRRLAIGTPSNVYLIDADRNLQRLNPSSPGFGVGGLRPIWQPSPAQP